MTKELFIRWNKSLLRTMPDAPKGYSWQVSSKAAGSRHKSLKEACRMFLLASGAGVSEGESIFAGCSHPATGDSIVMPFVIGQVKLVYRTAAAMKKIKHPIENPAKTCLTAEVRNAKRR